MVGLLGLAVMQPQEPDGPTIDEYWEDFTRHLNAKQTRPKTLRAYGQARNRYVRWAEANGYPVMPIAVRKEHVELFLAALGETNADVTVLITYRVLSRFFKWLQAEDCIPVSPLNRIPVPKAKPTRPTVLRDEELQAILAACKGNDFVHRRDLAIVRLLIDTGCRLGELATLATESIDRDRREVTIQGKGGYTRLVTYGWNTAEALDRYWRIRAKRRDRADPALWLGRRGPMTASGIAQVVKDRAKSVGMTGVHTHRFRHAATHAMLTAGMREMDVERLMGWQGPTMIRRYAASAADARVVAAFVSPGDRL
jgi:site-specific recombinase XerD